MHVSGLGLFDCWCLCSGQHDKVHKMDMMASSFGPRENWVLCPEMENRTDWMILLVKFCQVSGWVGKVRWTLLASGPCKDFLNLGAVKLIVSQNYQNHSSNILRIFFSTSGFPRRHQGDIPNPRFWWYSLAVGSNSLPLLHSPSSHTGEKGKEGKIGGICSIYFPLYLDPPHST